MKQDVTKRKAAEKALQVERQRLDMALRGANAGLWDWNADTDDLYTSDIWAFMLGYAPQELDERYGKTRRRWTELIHPEDLPRFNREIQKHINNQVDMHKSEFRMRTAKGQWKWILDIGRAFERDEQGKGTRLVGVQLDIDDIKNLQNQLQNAKLDAEQATRAKSDFLANMSHEIRTPMNAIIGMTHLALKTGLDSKQRGYLSKIDTAAKSLLGIINDILDFSKIEAGRLDLESIDFHLDDLMENITSLVSVKAQEKKLELLFKTKSDVPRRLRGDPLRLGQVLINLCNNAVKFTQKGEILVTTAVVSHTKDEAVLRFSVKDTGIGMTKKQVDKLFKPFSQADMSTTRQYGGTGLGLSISKRLVEMMDGSIDASSQKGKGSEFAFTARFGRHQKDIGRQYLLPSDLQGMHALVVDDNQTSLEIMKETLEMFGFRVSMALNPDKRRWTCLNTGRKTTRLNWCSLTGRCRR